MIKLDELIQQLNIDEDSDVIADDSLLMKYLNKLPGKHPNKKVFPRVSLICLGLLHCEGTVQDKAEAMFG